MADYLIGGPNGPTKRFKDMGDGTHAEIVAASGLVEQAIPDFPTAADLLSAYGNFAGVAPGDFVTRVQYSNGQVVTALSGGPLQVGESNIILDVPVVQPCAMEIEASMIRARQQFASICLFENDAAGPDPVPSPINITSIYQCSAEAGAAYNAAAGTICTVVLESALPSPGQEGAVYLSDWIHIAGLVDSRLNYQNACIKYISPDRKTITFGFSDEAALPSLAVPAITPPAGTAKVHFYNNLAGAHNGFGIRFTGTTATSAALVSVFGGGDAQVSGTLFGDHRISLGSTAPQYLNGVMGNVEIKATTRFRLEGRPAECAFLDKAIDNISATYSPRGSRTAVKPANQAKLRARFRLYQPVGMTRPVGKIISIAKTGTTTATVTHDGTYPFQTGQYVNIKGVRDQTNFAATTTPIAITVLSPTQFTCVVGSAVTATSYGGSVVLCNGGVDQPGIIGQIIQSAVLDSNGWITFVGNTTWAGLSVGDYINVHGVRDNVAGADLGIDGAWEVAHLSATTLIVKPIFDIFGNRVSPVVASLPLTNCGGSVILRTTLRSHDLMLEEWAESKVMIDGQGSGRVDKSLPVQVTSSVTVAVNQSAAAGALSATDGSGGWFIRPGITGIADIASAALTASSTTAAISNAMGNGFQVNIAVTAVSGTAPTLDFRVEESFDGGTNWVTLYEMQRITAVGNYNTPILRASGRHIRYVQTISGTTPSFTRAVVRTLLPFMPSEPQKRIVDRTIVPNTLNSVTPILFQGAANNAQLVVNMGAITTTAPAFQLEGSEDGTNFYPIGAPLTAVASSTVQVTVSGTSCTFVRARVSTAGVGATLGYVSVKAWS